MISRELMSEALLRMYLGRKFEEEIKKLFLQGHIHGTTHLAVGEEASAVGTALALAPQDYLFGTHRSHALAMARGLDPRGAMAEMLARETGLCKGSGGSMHLADPDKNFYTAGPVLGANAVIANGFALAIKKRGETDRVACITYGDGTSNEGATFEAMNLAAVWSLPTLFVCVNNTYGMSTHISHAMKDTDIAKRALPFGIPAETVDGNDFAAVYEAAAKARSYVAQHGPMLIVENTYRISGHSKSDRNVYRSPDEIDAWRERCPIKLLRQKMLEHGFSTAELDAVEAKAQLQIDDASSFALSSPGSQFSHLTDDIFA